MLVLTRLLLNRGYILRNALKALASIVSMCSLDRISSNYYIKVEFASHRKHTSPLQMILLTLFREIIAFYCKNSTEQPNTLWGRNAE
jgi:hypothetical protein